MDENTKKQLNDFLLKLINGAEKAGDFAIEQAPMVAQEVVSYGRAFETARAISGILVAIIGVVAVHKIVKRIDWDEPQCIFQAMAAGLVGMACGIYVGECIAHGDDLCKAWFAPRIYLIEYIRDAIK